MPNNFPKPRSFLFLWLAAAFLNIIAFLAIFFNGGLQGDNVALRYTVKSGVLWYGEGKNLYALPFFGLLSNLINFSLFKKLPASQSFLRSAAAGASFLIQSILILSLILLGFIN